MTDTENTPSYTDLGSIPVDAANDANIPVNIWLIRGEDDDTGYWILYADNYMPRRGSLTGESTYRVRAKDRDVLVELVHTHWLPLYQAAVRVLAKLEPDAGGAAGLYYWND